MEVDEAFGSSYENYTDLCASKGGRLCTFEEYCPGGEFGARFDETISRYHDSYAPFYKPIGDNFNNWLQVRKVLVKNSFIIEFQEHGNLLVFLKFNDKYLLIS